ncbi:MAG: hypothetical protein EB023_07575 [Flavobacteriia bacterium]|nr:hypothetical protein [Flavobacteriia bacterium]
MKTRIYLIGMNDSLPTRLVNALRWCPSIVTYVDSFQTVDLNHIRAWKPDALILSGSRFHVKDPEAPTLPMKIFSLGIPILGICYGFQWMIQSLGGRVSTLPRAVDVYRTLDMGSGSDVYRFRHQDYIQRLPKDWVAEWTYQGQVWVASHPEHKWLGIQFHPEFNKKTAEYFFNRWVEWLRQD